MKLTKSWLEKNDVCEEGLTWWLEQKESDIFKVIDMLMLENNFKWTNWLITNLLNKKQCVQYAVFCAELTLPIWQKEYPELFIKTAKTYIKNPSKENKEKARRAAHAVVYAADFFCNGAFYSFSSVCAAHAVVHAASCVVYDTVCDAAVYNDQFATAVYTVDTIRAAIRAADAGVDRQKILFFGINLLKELV